MNKVTTIALVCAIIALTDVSLPAAAYEQTITLQEQLGYAWEAQVVHRTIEVPSAGKLHADRAALYLDGRAVPMQLDKIETYADGSLRQADAWFRTDLPAKGSRAFVLREGEASKVSDLAVQRDGKVLEIANALTAVRLPVETNTTAGPVLGVKLASGKWTAASEIQPAAALKDCVTEILAQGPIFVRARTTYRFANGGSYTCEVTVRSQDPLVRIDERYENGGSVTFDLGTGLEPTQFATKQDYRGNMQLTPIAYDQSTKLPSFVGWDFYLPDRTAVLGLLGGSSDDLLALVSTSPDWLPDPYPQMFAITAEAPRRLTARGPLASGHRHWGLLVGKASQFPDPGRDLYRWFTRHIFIPLDKVAGWQLVWPEMEKIEFPHTFFSSQDLAGLRARLQAEPAIKAFMEDLRQSDGGYKGWSHTAGETAKDPAIKARFEQYRDRYKPRGGIAQGPSYISAGYLYFGDRVYLEQLADESNPLFEQTPEQFVDFFVRSYLEDIGALSGEGAMGSMNVSDSMLLRSVGLDLLLGSDVLTSQEKRRLLTRLAFMTYVMHEPEWQPLIHMPDGSRPEGYGQGTPNQKFCALSCRAMTAAILANHPMKHQWLKFAMDELRPHYDWTIAPSGALLESPFYSSRDTMRYAPFWSAMVRAGVKEVAPDYEKWLNRPKRAFQYLADTLTPKEPRMNGKRVYHPIGRSSPGVIDPTFMIGGDPWGAQDPEHAGLMRWCWQQQGQPSPDTLGTTGGRNIALTLIAFGQPAESLDQVPLRSKRYEGMGVIFRSHPDGDYESNVLFRHDPFCWDLYAVNNGAVYFYGKGAPLLPRFGAYWSHSYGGAWMMDLPFGNRVEFASGDNNCFGSMTEFAALGPLADAASGVTEDGHWRRSVLLAKDRDRDDPVYLLVRDDVNRPGVASVVNWWIMTRNVQPDGLTSPGVVPIKISHEEWTKNLGRNWKEAPKLTGQRHHFPGMCGVDVDLFIATPRDPQIVTDAASAGNFPYCEKKDLFETQQLVRISQPPGQGYLTLLVPRLAGSPQPEYRTIADGAGVAIKQPYGEDLLFLAEKIANYQEGAVDFQGRAGFVRRAADSSRRLMVSEGRVAADGISLASTQWAALIVAEGKVQVFHTGDRELVKVELPEAMKQLPQSFERVE